LFQNKLHLNQFLI